MPCLLTPQSQGPLSSPLWKILMLPWSWLPAKMTKAGQQLPSHHSCLLHLGWVSLLGEARSHTERELWKGSKKCYFFMFCPPECGEPVFIICYSLHVWIESYISACWSPLEHKQFCCGMTTINRRDSDNLVGTSSVKHPKGSLFHILQEWQQRSQA